MAVLDIRTARVFLPLLQPSRYKGAYGGRGCVHPDTLIDTPSGQVKICEFEGGPVFAFYNGRIVEAMATASRPYTEEQLYLVRLSDGREISVTDQHRFLTQRGWAECRDLSTSDAVVVSRYQVLQSHLLSTRDSDLSASLGDVRRCSEKLSDYLGGYSVCCRRCDQQPRSEAGGGKASAPLRDDGQRHSYHALTREDARGCASRNSPLLPLRRPSTLGALRAAVGRGFAAMGSRIAGRTSALLSAFSLCALRFQPSTAHFWRGEVFHSPHSGFDSPRSQAESRQKQIHKRPHIFLDGSLFAPSCNHDRPILIGVESICNHDRLIYWDLHVPGLGNYLSNGIVNHNSGKSHFFAELGVERCMLRSRSRGVCLREIQKDLKDSAKQLIEDKIQSLGLAAHFDMQRDEIITPGGGVIIFRGMKDYNAESIKSLEQFDWAWIEEAHTLSSRSLELLRPTIRAKDSEIWASWNPRSAKDPIDELFRGQNPPADAICVRANYNDNPFFPAELEQERQYDQKANRDRYGHIWLGEYEPMAVGAIWDRVTIHEGRRDEAPDLRRIVVAVDPAVTNEVGSDEHGIVVVGLGDDSRGYVLDDVSCHGSPRQWAVRAIAAFDKWEADAIVIEVNQGGDMVRHTLESVRPGLPIVEVRATRGKHIRAEPISSLYSLGRISHVGTFPKLEDQMCRMTSGGYEGEGSPDRVDAMIWGFSELFPAMTRRVSRKVHVPNLGDSSWMG